jgi:sulfotransferase family protein
MGDSAESVSVLRGASAQPVFVLCGGRSGSTLLRFLLDAHPDLACPPETNLPALCVQLATVWSLIEGAPLSSNRGDEPPEIPEAAIAGIRHTMDMMVGSYLTRRGKRRYCDKSLGTARFADLIKRVYPEAKFVCLYRHPMDVIASGIEACPWGLNGYGFDPYIAGTPGNVVFALARFWADNVTAIRAAEDQLKDACHRVRYEDLVADPEGVADGIFRFLGVPPAPGISAHCFSGDRERFGPADYKIWHTSRITADSVGRGWSVPAGMIAPHVLEQINGLTKELGYLPVDDTWGTASVPTDLRLSEPAPADSAPADPATPAAAPSAVDPARPLVAGLAVTRLTEGLARLDTRFTQRWEPYLAESFGLIVIPPPGARGEAHPRARWRVDLAERTVTPQDDSDDGDDSTEWDLIGPAAAWERVLHGELNLNVALRRCELRYLDTGEAGPVASDSRIGMLADLLGIASWRPAADRPPLLTAATVQG